MMISRVAEHCFWLDRYIERLETTARLVAVNRLVLMDAGTHGAQRWQPLVSATGEQKLFESQYGHTGYEIDDHAEAFMTWAEDNPTSIRSCLAAARQNARTTREVISREMWETLNAAWQWLNSAAATKEYKKDRAAFLQYIRRMTAEFRGNTQVTMLHGQAFHFMRLGSLLERADQTARAIAIRGAWTRHVGASAVTTPEVSAQWMTLLRLTMAVEPFFKFHSETPTGQRVTSFLLLEEDFPRSVTHCLMRAADMVERIENATHRSEITPTRKRLGTSIARLRGRNVKKALEADAFDEVFAQVQSDAAAVGEQAYTDFFGSDL